MADTICNVNPGDGGVGSSWEWGASLVRRKHTSFTVDMTKGATANKDNSWRAGVRWASNHQQKEEVATPDHRTVHIPAMRRWHC